ncbi:MAG: SPFH/Band 7/PHB domain protein [Bdellovibrionaceae bacterium]|nr:SPFH/Band 7/PHB domain protein [Pseudobdellovibrionaceae bacterium]
METLFTSIFFGIVGALIFEMVILKILKTLLFYTTVREGTCQVFVLFGKVLLTIEEPGLHFLWPKLTWQAFVINFLGQVYTLDLRMDQIYLRSQPVNSEEGAPMGVGVWYETYINDPISYLFKNSDPKGSLAANVSNATVRCLSNLPLSKMLEDRHALSQTVRAEVTQKSQDWGYKLGSVYIRKVHFRDVNMIREIESKVVNRLRQVTAAIKQDGDNQVHVITNTAQRTASIEFGRAGAVRPEIVGKALSQIAQDADVAKALFEVLETEKLLENRGELILVPKDSALFSGLLSTQGPS